MCKDSKTLFLEIHCGIYYIHVLLCLIHEPWTHAITLTLNLEGLKG